MALPREIYTQLVILAGSIIGIIVLASLLSTPIMGMFAIGPAVSPGGIFGAGYGSTYTSGTVVISGIDNEVTIIRDSWGIPHIYGNSQKDVVFALGYCHAQDRLFQMDLTLRQGMGRLSEIMGSSTLAMDKYSLRQGLMKAAQETLDYYEEKSDTDSEIAEMLDNMDAYCEGVNTVIEQKITSKTLPIEFKLMDFEPTPWTRLKGFVYGKIMSDQLTYSTMDLRATIILEEMFDGNETAMEELFPVNNTHYQVPVVPTYDNYTVPPPPAKVVTREKTRRSSEDREALIAAINNILDSTPESDKFFEQPWIGSNNWVAGGSKTTTGLPILSNDMHLSIALPHVWYEAQLCAPDDDLNVYGYTLTGVPLVIVGFNTHVAWGFTNVGNDAVDWYEYIWNDNQSQYWSGIEDGWKEPTVETVKIPVKGQPDEDMTIIYTEDGVIMTEDTGGEMIAMRWTATVEPTHEFLALEGANKAKNWVEFNESMQYFLDPTQNVVFADDNGTIALRPTGRFIKRSYFGEGRFVQNGSDPDLDKTWEYIPYNELPVAVEYEGQPGNQGYLASANQKSAGPDYQYYISSTQSEPYRGRSINRLLSEAPDGTIDVDFMKDAQCGGGELNGGILDIRAESFTPFIVDAVEQSVEATTGIYADALTVLSDWQESNDRFLMKQELVGPTLYYETMNWFDRYTWEDEWTEAGVAAGWPQDNMLEYLVREVPESIWFDNVSTTGVTETRDDILVLAFLKAVDILEGEFGSTVTEWLWGEYHQMDFRHMSGILTALDGGRYPHDGSGYTLLAAGGRSVRGGPSERMIVDFSNKSNSWSVIPTGASGIPTSPHYDDQIALWLGKEYHPMFVTHNTVESFPSNYIEVIVILKPA
ncbi:MAG: penicillin acylase family protein [Candidatus Hodarchaeales archaeon]